ncbi:MAG: D-tyrosyl-tRNA(Tyr) deacylase [Bryobacterales bacterium]|nr:D-tyrosyl-tRNA(Tyr) deacylase [Bryobacterales bacterium]
MRAVIQRVSRASVSVDGAVTGAIDRGILILLGVAKGDREKDADFLLDKIYNLRIFPDSQEKMNLSASDIGASLLVVSQFTLLGDCRKGRRPGFDSAAPPGEAKRLYEYFVSCAKERGIPVATGVFQASMQVELVNMGPVTFVLESSTVTEKNNSGNNLV